jgi:hypothetical protein
LALLALAYAVAHFVSAGIVFPLQMANLSKFEEEVPPLLEHLRTGEAIRANPVQWGPVFFLVMQPLVRASGGLNQTLAQWLYALQIVCLVLAFWLTCATLKPLVPKAMLDRWPLLVVVLGTVWLSFSPLLMVLAVKTVETWEVLLLALGLYAHLRKWRWVVAFALAAAGLIKVLPFVFFYYLLITDRRTFVYSCVALVVFLLAGHIVFGPQMGLEYLPRLARASIGNSYLIDWHENLSLKAALVKLLGHVDNPRLMPAADYYGQAGYFVVLSATRRMIAVRLGDLIAVLGFAWLTRSWILAARKRTAELVAWEWSVLVVAMLILSPHTAFEYITLALGAVSYAIVRLGTTILPPEQRGVPWLSLGAALFLVGVFVPRTVQNKVALVEVINRWTGYTHFTPSEAYQYYCFPLAGLMLLAVGLWRVEPDSHELEPTDELVARSRAP